MIDTIFLTPTVRPVIVPVKPKVVQKAEPVVEVKPWEKVPNAKEVMKNCYDGIVALNKILPPGWDIGNVVCSNGSAATSWKRTVGRVSWAQKALDDSGLQFSGKSFSSDGDILSATLQTPKAEEQLNPPQKTLMDLQDELNDTFQAIGVNIALSIGSVQSSTGATYRTLQFSLNSEYNPQTWIELLTKYSGLEIKLITYSPQDKLWHYEGAIYVL